MKHSPSCIHLVVFSLVFGLGFNASEGHAQEENSAQADNQAVFELGVGEARLLPVAGVPKTIIVGDDATIAANIIQDDILVFTGIAHGKTNVIVLDNTGQIIEQVWVTVTKSGAPLKVRRGLATQDFRCNPACRPEDELPVAPTAEETTTAVPG